MAKLQRNDLILKPYSLQRHDIKLGSQFTSDEEDAQRIIIHGNQLKDMVFTKVGDSVLDSDRFLAPYRLKEATIFDRVAG